MIRVKITNMGIVASIHRYPVKGLGPETLPSVQLEAGRELPFDRHWGLMLQDTEFDPANPAPVSKKNFLMLARYEQLANFHTRVDGVSGDLSLERDGDTIFTGSLHSLEDGEQLARLLETEIGLELRGRKTTLQHVDGGYFSDTGYPLISLINRASVDDIGEKMGAQLAMQRFRGNIVMDGLDAWQEMDWPGKTLRVGNAEMDVLMPIQRCNATNVNPDTGLRDHFIPPALKKSYGHMDCGVYARVTKGGAIATGADISVIDG